MSEADALSARDAGGAEEESSTRLFRCLGKRVSTSWQNMAPANIRMEGLANMSDFPRDIQVTLVCKMLPPVEEPVTVGIQDKGQDVHEGTRKRDGSFEFKCVIQVRDKGAGNIDFAGPFVHGKPAARFVYLSWKRTAASIAPWWQRVKVPLAFRVAELGTATAIQADITGRRPHATEPVVWTVTGRR
ncbi:DUF5990 family protein [Cupriavidus sp. RAF20_2]|uniref:DUF5990 family protein n=1 Tax=Cupriavidus sp. RAF20_2 TaxID=3233053 RepID=UPI003F929C65